MTVSGQNDSFADGDMATLVTVAVNAGSSDDAYDPVPSEVVTVTTVDNETIGFTVNEVGGNTVTDENGQIQSFSIVLDGQPESNVVILIANPDPGEITVEFSSRTFTPSNWSTPQSILVNGEPDGIADGDQIIPVTISVDQANSYDPFDSIANFVLMATNQDIDEQQQQQQN